MKDFKKALALILAFAAAFTAACAKSGPSDDEGEEQSAAVSDAPEESAQTGGEAPQGLPYADAGFDDGVSSGVHKLGSAVCGDVWNLQPDVMYSK